MLILSDIKQPQQRVRAYLAGQVPAAVMNAATGIKAVDDAIAQSLRNRLHATTTCGCIQPQFPADIAQGALVPARPVDANYSYLADHDMASNNLSWQWVAGYLSIKYFCESE
jgi:deoxyribodipyrimidine photo-lyase